MAFWTRALGVAAALWLGLGLMTPSRAETAAPPAEAQAERRVLIIGDSLGDGIWAGLHRFQGRGSGWRFIQKSKVATGLTRNDYYDWPAELATMLHGARYDAAVAVFGANDRQPIKQDSVWHQVGSDGWKQVYGDRIDAILQTLERHDVPVVWVGLPACESPRFDRDAQMINAVADARIAAAGETFLDLRPLTLLDGAYSAYLIDSDGRKRLMRSEDGVHFTMRGYLRIAAPVFDALSAIAGDGSTAAPAETAAPVRAMRRFGPAEACAVPARTEAAPGAAAAITPAAAPGN